MVQDLNNPFVYFSIPRILRSFGARSLCQKLTETRCYDARKAFQILYKKSFIFSTSDTKSRPDVSFRVWRRFKCPNGLQLNVSQP